MIDFKTYYSEQKRKFKDSYKGSDRLELQNKLVELRIECKAYYFNNMVSDEFSSVKSLNELFKKLYGGLANIRLKDSKLSSIIKKDIKY